MAGPTQLQSDRTYAQYAPKSSGSSALSLVTSHTDEDSALDSPNEDAKLLAGGHSLLPMMKLRLAVPAVLIDIAGIDELSGVRADGAELVIGATTQQADIVAAGLVRSEVPLLAHATSQVGDPHVRHRGTIGGSLAHADPAADLPMTLVALGGSVEITGPSGVRTVPADEFSTGFFETVLEPGSC